MWKPILWGILLRDATEEEVKAMGLSRNDPYSNNNNQGWRNHPNFSWRDRDQGNNANSGQGGNNYQKSYPNQRPQGQGFRQQPTQEQGSGSGGKKSLEEMLEGFISRQENISMKQEAVQREQQAAIKNLENQMGQMAKQLSERDPGTLPSDTHIPRMENASAITTRSGRVLNHVEKPHKEVIVEEVRAEKKSEGEKTKEYKKGEKESKVPFPKALMKKNLEKQFSKFVAMFKKLHVDLPFSEVLEKMPQYAKFMKEILSKKRRLSEMDEIVELTEECSAIIQRKLPVKIKDPGKFLLPVEFEGKEGTNGLIDLGASVNLMPLSMFERLNIGELKPTMIQLQLADRSIRFPWGVCEDVLIKVGKFVFPADFVILDMDEDSDMPLIFGRPFLATAKVKIDVEKRVVSVKAYGKKVKIKMPDVKEKPQEKGDVFLADMMEIWSDESLESFFRKEGTFKEKKPLPVEKKILKIKLEKEPSWLPKFWKRKTIPEPIRSEQGYDVFYVGLDEETPHGATHQGYNPG